MRRAASIGLFLAAAHAVLAGLFWGFLNLPESSVWTLALSGLLLILMVAVAGWTEATASLSWVPGQGAGGAARRGFAAIPAFLAAVLVFGAVWWATETIARWALDRRGEIDAWLMMRFGSPRTAWAHSGVAMALFFVRYIVGISMAAAVLTFGARLGLREMVRARWLRTAFSRRQIGAVGLAVMLLIVLPLQAVYWRPAGLPPTAMEPLFLAVKLGAIYLTINVGWSLVLRASTRGALAAEAADGRLERRQA